VSRLLDIDWEIEENNMGLTDYTISDKKYWQAGRDYEDKRIIKLLEERRKRVFENSLGQSGEIWHQYQGILNGIDMAIKLIKGEQK
jgi:hypothetical protein